MLVIILINHLNTITINNLGFFLHPCDEIEISQLIDNLKIRKAAGLDDISGVTLKNISHLISPFLVRLANIIFETGVYTDKLKIAKVTPIHKKGQQNLCSNYRPISVLTTTNKILEQLIQKRLVRFLKTTGFFYDFQYGFRDHSGTNNACIEIIGEILNEIDKGMLVSGLFLDLAKAFDTVNHSILLSKLESAGIRGVPLKLFESYLLNRKQFVTSDNCQSKRLQIKIGVPQGSVLGPLLFLIYINDIGKLQLKGSLKLFADDCALFYFSHNINENIQNLQSDLLRLEIFFNLNKLTLSVDKSKFINISKNNRQNSQISPPKYKNIEIEEVEEIKYLGLIIDKHLTWKQHISHIITKIVPCIGILRKLSYFIPKNVLFLIYYSLIHSQIQYLCCIWGNANKTNLNPIQVLQNRALKFIHGLPIRHSTFDLYVDSGILPVKGIYNAQMCQFIKGILTDKVYHTMNLIRPQRNIITRNANHLYYNTIRSNSGMSSVYYAGPRLFNALPDDIKQSSYKSFKKKVRCWLLHDNQLRQILNFNPALN